MLVFNILALTAAYLMYEALKDFETNLKVLTDLCTDFLELDCDDFFQSKTKLFSEIRKEALAVKIRIKEFDDHKLAVENLGIKLIKSILVVKVVKLFSVLIMIYFTLQIFQSK